MNIKLLVIFLLAAASTGHIYGYSWSIKNGTDQNLYIHLSTNYTNPIGMPNKGVLVKPGQVSDSAGKSEVLPKKFTKLIIADDEAMTQSRVEFPLNDDHNINYTITIEDVSEGPGVYFKIIRMHSNNKEYFNDQSITIQQQMTSQQKNEQRVAAEAMRLREQKQLIDSQKIASAEEKKRQDEERARQAEEAKRLEIKRQEDQQRNVEEQKLAEQQRADAERKRLEVQRTTAEEAKRQETKRQEEELAKMAEFQNNQIMPTLYRILKNPTTESKAAIDLFEKVKELEQGKNKDKIKEAIDGLISQGAHLNQALIFAIAEVVAPINQLRIAAEQSQSLQAFSEAVGKLSTSKFKDNIVNFILKEYKNKIKLGESDRIFNHTPLYIVGTFLAGNAMMLGSTKAQLGLASMLGAKKEIKELEKSSEQIKNRLYAYEKIALNLIANDAPKADFLSAIDDFAKSIDYAMGRQARMFKMQIGFDSIMDGIKGIAQGKKLPRN